MNTGKKKMEEASNRFLNVIRKCYKRQKGGKVGRDNKKTDGKRKLGRRKK